MFFFSISIIITVRKDKNVWSFGPLGLKYLQLLKGGDLGELWGESRGSALAEGDVAEGEREGKRKKVSADRQNSFSFCFFSTVFLDLQV